MSRGDSMKEFNQRIARVAVGFEKSAVRAILGEPSETRSRQELETPGDVLRNLGSTFNFDREGTDTVRVYRDPLRPRITHRIGFSDGRVVVRWKETAGDPTVDWSGFARH